MQRTKPTVADRVVIFDTTLRDGEQAAGAQMTIDEKIAIAKRLDAMGVDVIEAGFPAASEGDFAAFVAVASVVTRAKVCAFARTVNADIDRAGAALEKAAHKRINLVLGISDLHLKTKSMTRDHALNLISSSVARALKYTDDVEFIAEDATRANIDFLCACVETAMKAGATTVSLPDTVGWMVADEYKQLFETIRRRIGGIDNIRLGAHCHNDLGMATANSIAGLRGGARQVECTVNGIGERAGNASLEEIVAAFNVRRDELPFWCGVDMKQFQKASKLVSAATGLAVQHNKAIVGKNAFAHGSGMHQSGLLKDEGTYQIMRPRSVGVNKTQYVLTRHSGRAGFRRKLEEMGYVLSGNEFQTAFDRFKDLATRKKNVYEEDVEALLDFDSTTAPRVRLLDIVAQAGMRKVKTAEAVLEIDGVKKGAKGSGNGPVDASFKAIAHALGVRVSLEDYKERTLTEGGDAQVEIRLRLRKGKMRASGRGIDTDNVVASAQAYVQALNKLLNGRAAI